MSSLPPESSASQHGGSGISSASCSGISVSTRQQFFHMEMAQFHLPPKFDLTDGNLADSFRKWKRQLEVYMEAIGTTNKPKQQQTAIILHCAGPQVLQVYDHFQFDQEDDKNDPAKVLEKLEEYCNPRENEVLQSLRFWNIPFHEPFDVFLTELYGYLIRLRA